MGKSRKPVWAMIPLCVMRNIWRDRYMRCFEGLAHPLFRIKSFFISIVQTSGNVILPCF